jgi:hypothetical protein
LEVCTTVLATVGALFSENNIWRIGLTIEIDNVENTENNMFNNKLNINNQVKGLAKCKILRIISKFFVICDFSNINNFKYNNKSKTVPNSAPFLK